MKQIATKNGHAWPIFLAFHKTLKIFMIGLGQEDEIVEITLQSEIWWHDVICHEVGHCMKWPHSSNVRILSWPRALLFSERLVTSNI